MKREKKIKQKRLWLIFLSQVSFDMEARRGVRLTFPPGWMAHRVSPFSFLQ